MKKIKYDQVEVDIMSVSSIWLTCILSALRAFCELFCGTIVLEKAACNTGGQAIGPFGIGTAPV